MKSRLVSLLYGVDIEEKMVVAFERMQQIFGVENCDESAAFALSLIKDLVDFKDGICMLLTPGGEKMCVAAALGNSAELLLEKRISPTEGIVGLAIRNSEVVTVSDTRNDSRLSDWKDDLINEQTENAVCVPIQHEGRTIGAIELCDISHEKGFDQAIINILSYVAGVLAEHIDLSLASSEADSTKI